MGIAAALVRSSFLVNAVYAEAAREYGLTVQQGQLLCVLMAQPYGMGDLSAMLALLDHDKYGRFVDIGLDPAWWTALSGGVWCSVSGTRSMVGRSASR